MTIAGTGAEAFSGTYSVPDTLRGWSVSREEKPIVVPGEDAPARRTKAAKRVTPSHPVHLRYFMGILRLFVIFSLRADLCRAFLYCSILPHRGRKNRASRE